MPDVDATLADAGPRMVQQLANTLEDSVLTKVRVTAAKWLVLWSSLQA
jgi:hypothetical protein